jgi:hypothetical protein
MFHINFITYNFISSKLCCYKLCQTLLGINFEIINFVTEPWELRKYIMPILKDRKQLHICNLFLIYASITDSYVRNISEVQNGGLRLHVSTFFQLPWKKFILFWVSFILWKDDFEGWIGLSKGKKIYLLELRFPQGMNQKLHMYRQTKYLKLTSMVWLTWPNVPP